jgi:Uncharacterized Fe-S center protein
MDIQSVNIVFFSGTGGTRRAAESLKFFFAAKDISVNTLELNSHVTDIPTADFLVVLYPVYACNAPFPIIEWIEAQPQANGTPAAVISCSGGGSTTPNTACRLLCMRKLQRKGYHVVYDYMLVLPSNWIIRGDDRLMIHLLRALELNSEKIVRDILKETAIHNKVHLIDRLFSKIGEHVKNHSKEFGQKIKVMETCVGCGICSQKCPRGNITMSDGKPVFADHCVICLNCIYNCPKKALKPSFLKFVVIKEGFNIDQVVKKYGEATDLPSYKTMTNGWAWKGVRAYLEETEQIKN